MRYYFAPLEGITGYIYRNAHKDFYPGVDKYFTPFLTPKQNRNFTTREWNDIVPEHNEGVQVVPQIMTNRAEAFIRVAKELQKLGYEEVNLNLGCPSPTVVTKGKGAGFLDRPRELDAFLAEIYGELELKISIKTRIGREETEEFRRLLEIYNRYPVSELIIHPRVQRELYRGRPHLDVFARAFAESHCPVCYNGDLFTSRDYARFRTRFAAVETVMCGRGFLINPSLQQRCAAWEKGETLPVTDKDRLKQFHDRLLTDYQKELSGDRNVLFKMKELWAYFSYIFTDHETYTKKIRKSQRIAEYEAAVTALFQHCEIVEDVGLFGAESEEKETP